MRKVLLIMLVLAINGCTDFPDLETAVSARAQAAAYPAILPLDALLASVPPVEAGLGVGTLPQRLRHLQARAAQLRGHAVVDARSRARLLAALGRH